MQKKSIVVFFILTSCYTVTDVYKFNRHLQFNSSVLATVTDFVDLQL